MSTPRRLEAKAPVEAPPVPGLAPMAEADLPAVAAYHAAVFGADRAIGLRELFSEHPAGMVCRRDGQVVGYGLRHPDRVGPVLAEDQDTAAAIVAALSILAPAGPMTITVPSSQPMLDHLHR